MMSGHIDYDHAANRHTMAGPRTVLPLLFAGRRPASLLDVGCGVGTWLAAARAYVVEDLMGIDGVPIPTSDLLIPGERFGVVDLSHPWKLDRKFEVALCLEVAEHLDEPVGGALVDSLTVHADEIVFSAACPGQPGQHHVNCQWPEYWQRLFNARGFACSDAIRWDIWNAADVEVWYRQNMFVAKKDPARAGAEPRIRPVIHPDFLDSFLVAGATTAITAHARGIETGQFALSWYAKVGLHALTAKARRRAAVHRWHVRLARQGNT